MKSLIILWIVWQYQGLTLQEKWEYESMSDCMTDAAAIQVEMAKHISCTRVKTKNEVR